MTQKRGRTAFGCMAAVAVAVLFGGTSPGALGATGKTTVVTSLSVLGSPVKPVFVVTGRGLRVPRSQPAAPPVNRRLCRLHPKGTVGYDYGDQFYVTVYTKRGGTRLFGAGRYHPRSNELDCIGLVVLSHTSKRITFTFGAAYTEYTYPKLTARRFVRVVLRGAHVTRAVRFSLAAG